MRDIVATIQAEQDLVIRAPLDLLLVVQGGPGTGKTAVGLHRAALLLYDHRELLERDGVLVVGPNRLFLRYISQVLPSLGETSVVQTTVTGLGAVAVRGTDDDAVAALKGDLRMADVVARAAWGRTVPLTEDVRVRTTFGNLTLERRRGERRARRRSGRAPHRDLDARRLPGGGATGGVRPPRVPPPRGAQAVRRGRRRAAHEHRPAPGARPGVAGGHGAGARAAAARQPGGAGRRRRGHPDRRRAALVAPAGGAAGRRGAVDGGRRGAGRRGRRRARRPAPPLRPPRGRRGPGRLGHGVADARSPLCPHAVDDGARRPRPVHRARRPVTVGRRGGRAGLARRAPLRRARRRLPGARADPRPRQRPPPPRRRRRGAHPLGPGHAGGPRDRPRRRRRRRRGGHRRGPRRCPHLGRA